MKARKSRVDYPAAVVDTLADEFPDLTDPTTAAIVREAVARHTSRPHPAFECIIDDPLLAYWRIHPHRDSPSRVRVSCHRLSPTKTDRDREQRVNQALSVLAP